MDELTRLAHAARLGEPGAIDSFVEGCYPDVWRLCAGLVDRHAADDLAQESFLAAMRALHRFRGEASARTWILSITRNVCMDELRSRSRRRRRDERFAAEQPPDASIPDVLDQVGVRDLLARLDPDRRSAFVLTQVMRLSYDEAAEVCGCPSGTIRSRVARARDDLIGMLPEASLKRPDGRRSDIPSSSA